MVSRPNCRAPNRPVNYELQNSAQEKERALCDYRFQVIDFKAPGLPVGSKIEIGPAKRYPTSHVRV